MLFISELTVLGIGWIMVLTNAMVSTYYNVIIAWSIYYLYRSFTTVLPWSNCDNDWNTDSCVVPHHEHDLRNDSDDRSPRPLNNVKHEHLHDEHTSSPAEEFWE